MSVEQPISSAPGPDGHASAFQLALPAIFVAVLLLLGTAFKGAFDIKHWGPPGVFVLILLAALAGAGGGAPVRPRALLAGVAGIWALAITAVASALWAGAPADAVESGLRTVLYAAVFTVPIVILRERHSLRLTAHILTVGVAGIAAITLVRLLIDGEAVMIAGRLDAPVGYRNATALLFCLGFWPLIAICARRESPRVLRAAAFGVAELELGLAFLTQSRGVVVGFAAGGLIMVVLGPDRVRRAWLGLVALGLLAACSPGVLTAYRAFDGGQGVPSSSDITTSANWLAVLLVLGAVVGAAIAVFDSGLRPTSPRAAALKTVARAALAAVAVVTVLGGLVAVGNPVTEARAKWREFTNLQTVATGTTRYTNAGGQRYDLWRVAVDELKANPVAGVGAGNYAAGYYADRNNDRNLDDPHGLPFQVGAELGLVGLAALAVFLLGIAATVRQGWPRLEPNDRRLAAGMLATGAVLMGQSLVDWMWRIPGVTAIGIFALGVGVAIVARGIAPPVRTAWLPATQRVALAGVAGVLAALALVTYLSDYYVRSARADRGVDTAAQLSAARTAHSLNPLSLRPLYLEASALETMGRRREAKQVLLDAHDRVPDDFTTLGLLGDFDARGRNYASARAWYRQALAHNPLDTGLQQLAISGGRPAPVTASSSG
ncbi:MAG: O-antigen polymerase [Solirubrobacterales bacterium]|nr:O-antigen polymerase [Solirubrobacterales bacterium]